MLKYIKCTLLSVVIILMLFALGAFAFIDYLARIVGWLNKRRRLYMLHIKFNKKTKVKGIS